MATPTAGPSIAAEASAAPAVRAASIRSTHSTSVTPPPAEKPEAADLFVENHFHTVLLEKKIGRQLLQYKKGKSLYDDKNKGKESLERQMMKF